MGVLVFQVWRQHCVPFLGLLISTTARRRRSRGPTTGDLHGEPEGDHGVPGSSTSDGGVRSEVVASSSSSSLSALLAPYLAPSLPAFSTMSSSLLQVIDEKMFPFFYEFSMQVANGALPPSKAVDFLSRRLLPLALFHYLLIATDLRRCELLAVCASAASRKRSRSSRSAFSSGGSTGDEPFADGAEAASPTGQEASSLEMLSIEASLRSCFRSLPCSEKTLNLEAAVDFIFATFSPKKYGGAGASEDAESPFGGATAGIGGGGGGGTGGFLPICSRSCLLPLPVRSMLLDAITVVSEMCVHVDPSRTEYKQMKNNLGGKVMHPSSRSCCVKVSSYRHWRCLDGGADSTRTSPHQ